jgi:hypothetical protein
MKTLEFSRPEAVPGGTEYFLGIVLGIIANGLVNLLW